MITKDTTKKTQSRSRGLSTNLNSLSSFMRRTLAPLLPTDEASHIELSPSGAHASLIDLQKKYQILVQTKKPEANAEELEIYIQRLLSKTRVGHKLTKQEAFHVIASQGEGALRKVLENKNIDFSDICIRSGCRSVQEGEALELLPALKQVFEAELEKARKSIAKQLPMIEAMSLVNPDDTIKRGAVRLCASKEHKFAYVHLANPILKNIILMMSATHRKYMDDAPVISDEMPYDIYPYTTISSDIINSRSENYKFLLPLVEAIKQNTIGQLPHILDGVAEGITEFQHRRETTNGDISTAGAVHSDQLGGVFMIKTESTSAPLDIYNRSKFTKPQLSIIDNADEFVEEKVIENSHEIIKTHQPIATLAPHGEDGILLGFIQGDVVHAVRYHDFDSSKPEIRNSFFVLYNKQVNDMI